jgi:hypothetical protein
MIIMRSVSRPDQGILDRFESEVPTDVATSHDTNIHGRHRAYNKLPSAGEWLGNPDQTVL